MGQKEEIEDQLELMTSEIGRARTQLKVVTDYVKERIRIDNMNNGFSKAYDEEMIKARNSDVLIALGRLETII